MTEGQIILVKESIEINCLRKTKKTKKANNNKISHNNNKTKKEPNYMLNCPPKIINDPNIETPQERIELCRRHYEGNLNNTSKNNTNTKSHNNSPIKYKKNNSISKSNKNKSNKKIKIKLIVKKNINSKKVISKNTKKNSITRKWDGPHQGKYLAKYVHPKKTIFNSLEDAKKASEDHPNVGGITNSGKMKKYTLRKGKELINSPSGEVSWIKSI